MLEALPDALGALSIAFAIASFVATARRGFHGAERFAFAAIASGFATPLFACATLGPLLPVGTTGADASSKATILAAAIAELMNCTAFALPGIVLGLVAWGVVAWRKPRPDPRATQP